MKPIKDGVVTFPYGARYKNGRLHKGIDYRAATGTPVLASVGGTVVHAGRHIYKSGWGFAFGIHVIVDNQRFPDGSAGLWAGYCHLSRVNVKVGQKVTKGDFPIVAEKDIPKDAKSLIFVGKTSKSPEKKFAFDEIFIQSKDGNLVLTGHSRRGVRKSRSRFL